MQTRHALNKGFTIVELLIVVVVIAILAAITIVSYNGITARADDSARQTTATTLIKKIKAKEVTSGSIFPAATAPATRDAFLAGYDISALGDSLYIEGHSSGHSDFWDPNTKKVYMSAQYGGSTPHVWIAYWSNAQGRWLVTRMYADGTQDTYDTDFPPLVG